MYNIMSTGEEVEQDFLDFNDTSKSESDSVHESKRTSLTASSDGADEKPIGNDLLLKATEFFASPDTSSTKAERGSKRCRSSSSSKSSSGGKRSKKPVGKRIGYVSPSKIAKIFGHGITSENLCRLSAMENGTPSDIQRVMPGATVSQICDMCDLWESSAGRVEKPKTRSRRKPKKTKPVSHRSSKRRRRAE